jgi:transposase
VDGGDDGQRQQGLLLSKSDVAAPTDTIAINDLCLLRTDGEHWLVMVGGVPVSSFADDDHVARKLAMVSLVAIGAATQIEVAIGFGVTARTLRRYQHHYESGGLAALGRGPGYPAGRPREPAIDERVSRLKAIGTSTRAIAVEVGVNESAIRKRLRRLGWKPPRAEQLALGLGVDLPAARPAEPTPPAVAPAPSAPAEPPRRRCRWRCLPCGPDAEAGAPVEAPAADPNVSAPAVTTEATAAVAEPPAADQYVSAPTADTDPADRRFDRFLAHMGFIDDAAPLFGSAVRVPLAGVLFALPSLVGSGVFDKASQVYGSIGPAFYGLRTTLLTLLFMALWRIKRPESLKEHSPRDLGRVIGLDRVLEVKTLRRKLTRLARLGGAGQLGYLLAKHRVALRGASLGFLYVDGHVRVYHGKRRIPKTHSTRTRMAMPATTDYWVNDQVGDPLFVVTAAANAGMVKMLPEILDEVRALLGKRRLTIVFDRGGFSPKLFAKLVTDFDILTYRKGTPNLPDGDFADHEGVIDGQQVAYRLADGEVTFLDGKLTLRQVTRLKNGRQTPILTSRRDLSALEVAFRMFDRWKQENYFRYMREEFVIDALADYRFEPDDATREVPNPAWADADTQLHAARAVIARLQAEYGAAAIQNPDRRRPTMRGFKRAHSVLAQQLREAMSTVDQLERKRAAIPRRIPVGQREGGVVIKLATERKHLMNVLKMLAYQAESDLATLLEPHFKRTDDEGRTLVHTLLASAADITVTDDELLVTLAPLSSAHRSIAVAAICDKLNATLTTFPGTKLFLRYQVAAPPAALQP